jgi:nitrogen fixation protein FixH
MTIPPAMTGPPAAPAPAPTPTTNRWPYFAVVTMFLVVLGDGTMVTAAHLVHPGMVEDHPYQASAGIDQEKAVGARFAATGARLAVSVLDPGHLRCTIAHSPAAALTALGPLTIRLYRPDSPALDRDIPWPDPATPATVALTRDGLWHVYLRDRQGMDLAETAVDAGSADTGTPTAPGAGR